ncbi:hypothetical protein DM02DRAFT_489062, partial [Periconia macrospinosa]
KSTRPSLYQIQEWIWEFLGWLLGTFVITGTVILLHKSNQTFVTDWHYNVQLSTLVAVLAQVTQSLLLFTTQSCISQLKWTWFKKGHPTLDLERYDQASRGPWGSLRILVRLSKQPY